jgi:hypothetical protein
MPPTTVLSWTSRDIDPEDRQEYEQLIATLEADFQPTEGFEVYLTSEIARDTWRLRAYAILAAKQGLSEDIEKCRCRVGTNLRRNLAELRTLQTERQVPGFVCPLF